VRRSRPSSSATTWPTPSAAVVEEGAVLVQVQLVGDAGHLRVSREEPTAFRASRRYRHVIVGGTATRVVVQNAHKITVLLLSTIGVPQHQLAIKITVGMTTSSLTRHGRVAAVAAAGGGGPALTREVE